MLWLCAKVSVERTEDDIMSIMLAMPQLKESFSMVYRLESGHSENQVSDA